MTKEVVVAQAVLEDLASAEQNYFAHFHRFTNSVHELYLTGSTMVFSESDLNGIIYGGEGILIIISPDGGSFTITARALDAALTTVSINGSAKR